MEVIETPEIPKHLHGRIRRDIKNFFERMGFCVGKIDLSSNVFDIWVKDTVVIEKATLWISEHPLSIQERVNLSKFCKSYIVSVVFDGVNYSISYFHSKRFRCKR